MSATDALSRLVSPGGAGAPDAAPGTTDRAQVQALAQEFESMLLLQVMRQVRQTVAGWGGEDDEQEGAMPGGDLSPLSDTLDGELARYMSKAGGFGLSTFLSGSLSKVGKQGVVPDAAPANPAAIVAPQLSLPATAPEPTSTAPAEPAPRKPADPIVSAPSTNPPHGKPVVTSAFGWRTDPILHSSRFHGGVDIRAAYGEPVPAAAEGRVVLAREQGDYGLTVVVAHANGFQTRYAHLSSISVAEGDSVAENQTIGLVGRSGRATGPHLHFELTRNGQKVDPASAVQARAFKGSMTRADSTSSSWSDRLITAE